MSVGKIAVAAIAPCRAPGVAYNQDTLTISRTIIVPHDEHGVSFQTSLMGFRRRNLAARTRKKTLRQPEAQRHSPALAQAAFDFGDGRADRLQARVPAYGRLKRGRRWSVGDGSIIAQAVIGPLLLIRLPPACECSSRRRKLASRLTVAVDLFTAPVEYLFGQIFDYR